MNTKTLQELLKRRRPGFTLEQDFYASPEVFEADMQAVFRGNWLFAGHVSQIPKPGDYLAYPLANDSIILMRNRQDQIRAFYNTCRHRGSRLLDQERGHVRSIVCPYHHWVYDLDGNLTGARLMGEDFNRCDFGLRACHVRLIAGMIYIHLGEQPGPFDDAEAAIAGQLEPHGPLDIKPAAHITYHVDVNWKVLVENNRECYHCAVAHPSFMTSNFDLGLNLDRREDRDYQERCEECRETWRRHGLSTDPVSFPGGSWYRVARLPLRRGFVTESMDGRRVAPLLGRLTTEETGSLRMVTLPNAWHHANCDYLMMTRLAPLAPLQTRIDVDFYVHRDAVEETDYHVDRLVEVWRNTSEEDWRICRLNQQGILSSAYTPGPYSSLVETAVENWQQWYLGQLASGLRAGVDTAGPEPADAQAMP